MANSSPKPVTVAIPAQAGEPSEPVIDLRDSTVQLRGIKRHRSQLRRAMTEVEVVLARPLGVDADAWADAVRQRLTDVRRAFDAHVMVHEGPDSFHADVVRSQPRLAPHVASLQRDHRRLDAHIEALSELLGHSAPDLHEVRIRGLALVEQLARHRQRGADVVWEAFNFDLGGEH